MKSALRYVAASLVLVAVACSPPAVEETDAQGYILKPGEGEDTVGDGSSITKASPRSGTQGTVFVEDLMVPSGTSGIHRHLEADELFYVVNGAGSMFLNGQEHPIAEGDFIFVPVGTDHFKRRRCASCCICRRQARSG